MPLSINYRLKHAWAWQGYDRKTCWVQARAAAIPSNRAAADPKLVLTMQKLLLSGSDVYYGIHTTRSEDLGRTWTEPQEQPTLRRQTLADGQEVVPADWWPKWHFASGTLLGTGHSVQYVNHTEIKPDRPRFTPYCVYDLQARQWGPQETLQMPDPVRFRNAGAGCTQRVDLPDGQVLLPIYYRLDNLYATVLRCAFDGVHLRYLEHGTELGIAQQRGYAEPSLAHFQNQFYLTLRNDLTGYVTRGEDGLHFQPPIAWRFDDGQEVGNYNTQQHWVTHSDGLFLVYTRRGLHNDHVFRHRAPLLMAQVDPERLCLIRDTERVVVPQRGARLGNFGITEVSPRETWVVAAEWMQTIGPNPRDSTACERHGADNAVWVARILWDRLNELFGKI